ncbi:MAG TPA: cob(I)yrinic acid a,c-diamide adenosyltransferase [Arenicellales bacterium]|nr:cob(I)yrinic acid a,c-diamide adenosyltransferase [Arenicellales bacterium]
MGNRLSKIYTRTGDDGSTGLGDGSRIPKDDARVEAMGTVDELNSTLGLIRTEDIPQDIAAALSDIQHNLFDLGGELSIPGYELVKPEAVDALESELDRLNAELEPLKEFILPGGTRAAAWCHLARATCRRAERRVVTLAAQTELTGIPRQYLNRLSDYLFVLARYLNKVAGHNDVMWNHERKKS